jgi:hypothetical protein
MVGPTLVTKGVQQSEEARVCVGPCNRYSTVHTVHLRVHYSPNIHAKTGTVVDGSFLKFKKDPDVYFVYVIWSYICELENKS